MGLNLLNCIYSRPLAQIILLMVVLSLIWGWVSTKNTLKRWDCFNRLLLLPVLGAILYATLSNRESGTYPLILNPLAKLEAALIQPELYREMLMNAFLFFPLGLTLSHALPCRLSLRLRIGITVIIACLLSTGIECAQCYFSLGLAETNDIVCNTSGAFVGATSLLIAHAFKRRKERSLQK